MTSDALLPFPSGDAVRDERMLDRYFAGECSPGEQVVVQAWLDAHPHASAVIRHFSRYPDVTVAVPDVAVSGLWAGFQDRVRAEGMGEARAAGSFADGRAEHMADGQSAGSDAPATARSGRVLAFPRRSVGETAGMAGGATVKKIFRPWPQARLVPHSFRRAADFGVALGAVILTLGIGSAITYVRLHGPSAGVTLSTSLTEVATARGQRATIRLPDGSRVILSVDSRLRYPRDFGARSREVVLEGEAYFDVIHDDRVPFRVRTPHGVSEDIGTRFAVRAYAGELSTHVIVEEGRVGVGHGVTLKAGDVARLTADAPPAVQHGAPVATLLAWTHGQLEFVKIPLGDVLLDIRRWYDVEVALDDPALARWAITASFGAEPARDALETLAHTVDARLERRGALWVLVPKAQPTDRRSSSADSSFPTRRD